MSIISEDEVSMISSPSLAYPSLLLPQQLDLQEQQQEQKSCIHFASRLIKLRSELRSPSYMRSSSSFVLSQQQSRYNDRSSSFLAATTTTTEEEEMNNSSRLSSQPSLISSVGRTQSSPSISLLLQHPYAHKLDCQQDESEIASTTTSVVSSCLTEILLALQRQKTQEGDNKHLDHAKINHLALPPLPSFSSSSSSVDEKKQISSSTSKYIYNKTTIATRRSVSLQDKIVLDETASKKEGKGSSNSERMLYSSSLTLASQLLLYASQQLRLQKKKEQQKEEGDDLAIINNNKKSKEERSSYNEDQEEETKHNNNSKFINSIKKKKVFTSINHDETLRLIPSLSLDTIITNKSLRSVSSYTTGCSSDLSSNKATSNAVFVTMSPCLAAAASVARSKRSNIKQQLYLTRLSYSSSLLQDGGKLLLKKSFDS